MAPVAKPAAKAGVATPSTAAKSPFDEPAPAKATKVAGPTSKAAGASAKASVSSSTSALPAKTKAASARPSTANPFGDDSDDDTAAPRPGRPAAAAAAASGANPFLDAAAPTRKAATVAKSPFDDDDDDAGPGHGVGRGSAGHRAPAVLSLGTQTPTRSVKAASAVLAGASNPFGDDDDEGDDQGGAGRDGADEDDGDDSIREGDEAVDLDALPQGGGDVDAYVRAMLRETQQSWPEAFAGEDKVRRARCWLAGRTGAGLTTGMRGAVYERVAVGSWVMRVGRSSTQWLWR